ncbi:MAG: hypothetical protein ACI83B_004143 [Sediminicola sp.]
MKREKNKAFEKEYTKPVSRAEYFHGGPFLIYTKTYSLMLRKHLKDNCHDSGVGFLFGELNKSLIGYNEFDLSESNRKKIEKYLFKRFLFIKRNLEDLGFEVNLTNDKADYTFKVKEEATEKFINHSPEIGFYSIPQKIIFMKELGVIEHLRTIDVFKDNRSCLALVLSKLTNEKQTSIELVLRASDNRS